VSYVILCFLGVAQGKSQWRCFEQSLKGRLNEDLIFIYVQDDQSNWLTNTIDKVNRAFESSPNAGLILIAHSAGIGAYMEFQRSPRSQIPHPPPIVFLISPPLSKIVYSCASLVRCLPSSLNVIERRMSIPGYYFRSSQTRLGRLHQMTSLDSCRPYYTLYVLYGSFDVLVTGGPSRINQELNRLDTYTKPRLIPLSWPFHNPLRWAPHHLAKVIEQLVMNTKDNIY
jgi:hypothetical protein